VQGQRGLTPAQKIILEVVMKTTQKWSKMLLLAMSAMVLSFGLMSCATTKYIRSDPLALEQTGDYIILRVKSFVKANVNPFAKIDGVVLTSNEILLPAETTEHDVKFIVQGNYHKFVIQAKVTLPVEAGQTYLLAAELTPGSRAASLLISAWLPREFRFVLYEYSSDQNKYTQLSAIEAVNLTMEEF
jgi:hypothetical protein